MILRKISMGIVALVSAVLGTFALGTFLESQLPGREFIHGMAHFLLLVFAAGSYAVTVAAVARLRSFSGRDFSQTLPIGYSSKNLELRGSRIALGISAALRRTSIGFFLLPLISAVLEFGMKFEDSLRFDQSIALGFVLGIVFLVLGAICNWIAR